jgi:hypothetical protein
MQRVPNLKFWYAGDSVTTGADRAQGTALTKTGTVNLVAAEIGQGFSATWNNTNRLHNISSGYSVGTGDCTIAIRIKQASKSTNLYTPTIFMLGSTNTRFYFVTHNSTNTDKLSFQSYDGVAFTNVNTSLEIYNNVWRHICGVRSGTTMKLYVDGVYLGTATGTIRNITDSGIRFGASPDATYDFLQAAILADAQIYNYALPAADVMRISKGLHPISRS